METKVVCIGDAHFQVSNILEVEEFILKCLNYVKDNNPDFIVVLGDLLHTHERLHTTALNKAHNFIHQLSNVKHTFVLVGNHDMINHSQYLNEEHWMNAMKKWDNVTIVDTVKTYQNNDMNFIFLPYVNPGRFQEALNTINENEWKRSKCIFAHQEFAGCKMGAQISVEGDNWEIDNPMVISGHIHSNQRPQENIYYPGSSMEHSFGESQRNIIALAIFKEDEKIPEVIETDLQLPRKRLIYLNIVDVYDYEIPNTKDKLKLSINGSYCEFKIFKKSSKYQELIANGIKIVFKSTKSDVEIKNEMIRKAIATLGENTSFNDIIKNIVINEKDPYLLEAYELVVNNNKIEHNDVMFLE